jgi:tetratricopeptide (TPR) repeat protein
MRIRILAATTAIFLVFFGCTTHKSPSLEPAAPETKDFDYYLTRGKVLIMEKDIENAVVQLKQAVSLNPSSQEAHNLLGIAYFQQKDYRMAEKEFKKTVNLDPSDAQAYNNLGGVYFMQRRFNEAEQMYKKALSISSEVISAYYSLGSLLCALGKIEESAAYISKGVELDPNFLERNEAIVANLSSLVFNSPEFYLIYAKVYASRGDVDKTLEYFKKAKSAGFSDWDRILKEKEFEKIREDPKILDFLRQ